MSEAHCNKLPQRKALGLVTHDNTGGPFVVECQGCGEVYPSFHCLGGEQIADTGDYEDARYPHCYQVDPHECDNAALAWNTQQLKINELQQRLNAADQRIDDMTKDRESLIAYGRGEGLDEAATVCSRMAYDAYYPAGSRFKHFVPKAQEQMGNLLIKAANTIANLPGGSYERHCARQQKKAEKSATA